MTSYTAALRAKQKPPGLLVLTIRMSALHTPIVFRDYMPTICKCAPDIHREVSLKLDRTLKITSIPNFASLPVFKCYQQRLIEIGR